MPSTSTPSTAIALLQASMSASRLLQAGAQSTAAGQWSHHIRRPERQCPLLLQAGIHQFIEKPLSVKPPEEVADLSDRLGRLQQDKGLIIAVGYMLRYSPAVEVRPGALQQTPRARALPAGRGCLALLPCRCS